MITSLRDISYVADQVRMNALQSFEFLSNHVLCLNVEENLAKYVQDIVEDKESHFINTNLPHSLAIALQVWLSARGVMVLSEIPVPRHEILEWLRFDEEKAQGKAVTLEVQKHGVQLTWL